jgi:uncharacterized protein with ParB-like and HNH nuclease domain
MKKLFHEAITDTNHFEFYDIIDTHSFKVPRFQRYYEWTKEQVEELIDDIISDAKNWDALFLGILIFKGKKENKIVTVIDGQQRILTFLIILRVLIENQKLEDNYKNKFKKLLKNTKIDEEQPKLQLNLKYPNEFFKNYILKGNEDTLNNYKKTTPIKNIIKAKEVIFEKINGMNKSKINKIAEFMNSHIEVVRVLIEDEAIAFDIFESINAKKLDLAVSDLTKILLYKKCTKVSPIEYDKADKKWSEIVDLFDASETIFTKFLRVYWASKEEITRGKRFYKKFQKSKYFKTKAPLEIIEDILSYAKIYKKLLEPRESDWGNSICSKKVFSVIENMNFLSFKTHFPLFIQLIRNFKIEQIPEILEKVEHLSFVSIVLFGERPSILEILFSNLAVGLFQKIKNFNGISKEINDKLNEYSDYTRIEHFLKEEKSFCDKNKQVKYILFKIMKQMGPTTEFLKKKISELGDETVEHILPQNYDRWRDSIKKTIEEHADHFEKEFSGYSIDEKIKRYHEKYCYSIGNLSLLTKTDNSKTQHKTFEEKKKIYIEKEKDNYLFKDVIESPKWTFEEIDKRTENISNDLKKVLAH